MLKKLFSLFAALTLSVGLWAETVSYRYPTYVDDDVTKGIKEWKTTTVDATEVTSATSAVTWGTAGQTTWFVVKGTNVQLAKGAICNGDVRLILADNAKLTATGWFDETEWIGYASIQVSGEGNSLTIYAQSTGTQMGQLIATGVREAAGIGGGNENGANITINGGTIIASGEYGGAGIGGGNYGNGSNITINGGIVTATGGLSAAGIGGGDSGSGSDITINGGEVTATGGDMGAGIGGGADGSGSNITINGGIVTTTGAGGAAGIGGGADGSGSNIFVATSLQVKADGNNPPTTVIENDGTDLTEKLLGRQYVTVEIDIPSIKAAAIAAVNAEISETDNDNVKAIATSAATAINAATTEAEIYALKDLAIANIASAKAAYTAGESATLGEMGTPCVGCTAIKVTKGDKTVTLYAPDNAEFIKAVEE